MADPTAGGDTTTTPAEVNNNDDLYDDLPGLTDGSESTDDSEWTDDEDCGDVCSSGDEGSESEESSETPKETPAPVPPAVVKKSPDDDDVPDLVDKDEHLSAVVKKPPNDDDVPDLVDMDLAVKRLKKKPVNAENGKLDVPDKNAGGDSAKKSDDGLLNQDFKKNLQKAYAVNVAAASENPIQEPPVEKKECASIADEDFKKNLRRAYAASEKPVQERPVEKEKSALRSSSVALPVNVQKTEKKADPLPKKQSSLDTKKSGKKDKKEEEKAKLPPPAPRDPFVAKFQNILQRASEFFKGGVFSKAADHYQEALDMMKKRDEKSLLDEKSAWALRFCCLIACIECKTVAYLEKAESQIETLDQSDWKVPIFSHLSAYFRGRFHVRLNNYEDGLRECDRAKEMIDKSGFEFPIVEYPGLGEALPISEPDEFKKRLNELWNLCKAPPKPDAKCGYNECKQPRSTIYSADRNFDGYYVINCSDSCNIAFHVACYKAFKKRSDVDGGQLMACLTPDCDGKLVGGHLVDKDNEIKTRFTYKGTEQNLKNAKEPAKVAGQNAKVKAEATPGKLPRQQKSRSQSRPRVGSETMNEDSAETAEPVRYLGNAAGRATFEFPKPLHNENLVEREAHLLRRDEDDNEEPMQAKKKKTKKAKPRPVIVTTLEQRFSRRDEAQFQRDREQSEETGFRRITDGWEEPPMFNAVNRTSGDASFVIPPLGISKWDKEFIDEFLSMLRALVNERPNKTMAMDDEDLQDLLSNIRGELNQIICDTGGLPAFLQQYGEEYRLSADDKLVVLYEVDSDSGSEVEEEEEDEDNMGNAPMIRHGYIPPKKTLEEHMDEYLQKENYAKKVQVCKDEIINLKKQLNDAEKAIELAMLDRNREIDVLVLEKEELEQEWKETKKAIEREHQKMVTDTRNHKVELERLAVTEIDVQSDLDAKEASIDTLHMQNVMLNRGVRALENNAQAQTKKPCTCLRDASVMQQRAVIGEIALLRLKSDVEPRDLEQALLDGTGIIEHLALIMNKPGLANKVEFAECKRMWESNVAKLREDIARIKTQYSAQIKLVESGMSMQQLPIVVIPEIPVRLPIPEPIFMTKEEQALATSLPSSNASFASEKPTSVGGGSDTGHSAASSPVFGQSKKSMVAPPGFENSNMAFPNVGSTSTPAASPKKPIPVSPIKAPVAAAAAAVPDDDSKGAASGPSKKRSIEQLVIDIKKILPDFSEKAIMSAIKKFYMANRQNGGMLRETEPKEYVEGVCKLLLENRKENNDKNECMICLDPLASEPASLLLCGRHTIHEKCIRNWAHTGKACPICGV